MSLRSKTATVTSGLQGSGQSMGGKICENAGRRRERGAHVWKIHSLASQPNALCPSYCMSA